MNWKDSIWISKQEAKLPKDSIARSNKVYQVYRTARPYVVGATSLPKEFADWEGRTIDLRFEQLGPEKEAQYGELFAGGAAIGLCKSGRWWAIRSTGRGVLATGLEVVELTEEEAATVLSLPKDWEHRVAVRPADVWPT